MQYPPVHFEVRLRGDGDVQVERVVFHCAWVFCVGAEGQRTQYDGGNGLSTEYGSTVITRTTINFLKADTSLRRTAIGPHKCRKPTLQQSNPLGSPDNALCHVQSNRVLAPAHAPPQIGAAQLLLCGC